MAVVEVDGFKFHDGLSSDCIVVEDSRVDEYVNYINDRGIKCLTINDLYYLKHEIEFLEKCPNIQEININSPFVQDFSPLYHMKNLKTLYLEEPKEQIDLSSLNTLEELALSWNKKVKGLGECKNLKILRLWKYKPKNGNLEEISKLNKLEELILTQTQIMSLKGCGKLDNLEKLELNYINKLEIIDEIENNSNMLKNLKFDSCKKIRNHEYVKCLKELELLAFDNCGDILSIGFIKELPKLKSFIFVNTNIMDGDLSPCLGLRYVGFLDKKHYSHKRTDFMEA